MRQQNILDRIAISNSAIVQAKLEKEVDDIEGAIVQAKKERPNPKLTEAQIDQFFHTAKNRLELPRKYVERADTKAKIEKTWQTIFQVPPSYDDLKSEGWVRRWTAKSEKPRKSKRLFKGDSLFETMILPICVSNSENLIIAQTLEGNRTVLDASSLKVKSRILDNEPPNWHGEVKRECFSKGESFIAIPSNHYEPSVNIVEVGSGETLSTLKGFELENSDFSFEFERITFEENDQMVLVQLNSGEQFSLPLEKSIFSLESSSDEKKLLKGLCESNGLMRGSLGIITDYDYKFLPSVGFENIGKNVCEQSL